MLKHYNIDSAMVMAMEQKDLTVEDRSKEENFG